MVEHVVERVIVSGMRPFIPAWVHPEVRRRHHTQGSTRTYFRPLLTQLTTGKRTDCPVFCGRLPRTPRGGASADTNRSLPDSESAPERRNECIRRPSRKGLSGAAATRGKTLLIFSLSRRVLRRIWLIFEK